MPDHTTVYLVDDNAVDRRDLAFTLGASDIETWPFASAGAFIATLDSLQPQVVLFAMEEAPHPGPELVRRLQRRDPAWPMIALSRSRDVRFAVDVIKTGVLDFMTRPVDQSRLVPAIRAAYTLLQQRLEEREVRHAAASRTSSLTPREALICGALLAGQPNKIIAHHLGISIRTVEAHRSNVMMKLNARNFAEVFVLLTQAGFTPTRLEASAGTRKMPFSMPFRDGGHSQLACS